MKQIWVGSTDIVYLLRVIGGWHVDCQNAEESSIAVQYAIDQGWITTRTHYAPIIPEGAPAYELTEAGMTQLRIWDAGAAKSAEKMRNWYRVSTEKYRLRAA